MGTQAYSVIEQGKVDALLQSSPRDRRVIFEEAAGISRFKTRKIEALRRLEHVDQNLLRLSDIVDEVENRLRSVRAQASKARRYKEHTNRLQELRTQVGQVDWKRLTDRLAEFEGQLQSLGDERNAAAADADNIDAQLLDLDHGLTQANEEIRQAESQIAVNRERIAGAETTIEHERSRGADLEQEIVRYRRQLAGMSARAGDLQQQLRDTTDSLQAAETNQRDVAKRLVEAERGLSTSWLRSTNFAARTSSAGRPICSRCTWPRRWATKPARWKARRPPPPPSAGAAMRMADLQGALEALQTELEELRQCRERAARQVEEGTESLAAAEGRILQLREQRSARQKELAEMRERRSGAAERAAVLDELVRRHEGLNAGVKDVLQRAADPADAVFRGVRGLVADLLHVSVETAPLVEIALGQAAQHVVAAWTEELASYLQTESNRLAGRVGFVWLDGKGVGSLYPIQPSAGKHRSDVSLDLTGRPGVLGRADRFVEARPELAPTVERLLGRTWFVEKLAHALSLAATAGPGMTYVTLDGDLLEPDGTLTVGPRSVSTGLISRRSQLRALQAQLAELEAGIGSAQSDLEKLDSQIDAEQRSVDKRAAEHRRVVESLAENRLAMTTAEERRSQLDQQRELLIREQRDAQQQHDGAVRLLSEAREKRRHIEAALAELESNSAETGRQIDALEGRRLAADRETTEIKVELAKSEERLRNLRARMRQFEESREEREHAIEEACNHLAECVQRVDASRWNILRAEAEIADLYLRKETFAAQTVGLSDRRETLQAERAGLAERLQAVRGRVRKLEEKIHAAELAANEVRHDRASMADRLREDYGIELADLEHTPTDEEQHQREEVQQEIEELRQKINNLGNVNLESLDELEQLEARHQTLSDQHADLDVGQGVARKDHRADQRRQPAAVLRNVRDRPRAFSDALPRSVRRRAGRCAPGGERRYSRQRD